MIVTNKNLNSIQVLRGIASLLVVFFHVTLNAKEILHKKFFFDFFFFGGSGVDIFFVLSGFIITYTNIKATTNPANILIFTRRRFVRIFPTYWILITFFLLAQAIFYSFYKTHYNFDFRNILSTYFLLPGHTMVNGVSWTLSYELFFYFLFSLAYTISNKKWLISLLIYSTVIIFISAAKINTLNTNNWLNVILFPMNVEFLMGVIVAFVIKKIPSKISLLIVIFGCLYFLASGIYVDQHLQLFSNGLKRVVLFGIPSFIIIIGLVKLELNKYINVHNILLTLGKASYSLYLLHLPIIVACFKIFSKFDIQSIFTIHAMIFLLITVICYASILFFKYVEAPMIKKLNSKFFFK